jgi:uncharacterized protein (DUF1684 family)
MYRFIRECGTDSKQAFSHFRRTRDTLFRTHPQSPLDADQKATFAELNYYDYQPAYRVVARVDTRVESTTYDLDLGRDGRFTLQQFGQVSFDLPTGSGTLGLFWIHGYGGGIFLPFRYTTNNRESYGGGRYLYDTIKGADLGTTDDEILLDFNYAYHPSCHYNSRWVCPLAPPQNTLAFPVKAGGMIWKE